MEGRHKKVQIVIAALTPSGEWQCLILQTNKERGHYWQNVTGSVDDGETFEEGALREAQEETGLPLEVIVDIQELGLVHTFLDRWKRKVEERCFLIVCESQWKPEIHHKEHENWRWISLNEVKPTTLEWPTNSEALEKAARILRRMAA